MGGVGGEAVVGVVVGAEVSEDADEVEAGVGEVGARKDVDEVAAGAVDEIHAFEAKEDDDEAGASGGGVGEVKENIEEVEVAAAAAEVIEEVDEAGAVDGAELGVREDADEVGGEGGGLGVGEVGVREDVDCADEPVAVVGIEVGDDVDEKGLKGWICKANWRWR